MQSILRIVFFNTLALNTARYEGKLFFRIIHAFYPLNKEIFLTLNNNIINNNYNYF